MGGTGRAHGRISEMDPVRRKRAGARQAAPPNIAPGGSPPAAIRGTIGGDREVRAIVIVLSRFAPQ